MRLPIVQRDEWLLPVESELNFRYDRYKWRLGEIRHYSGSLRDYANAHLYYGVHYDPTRKGWWVREWLPGAKEVTVFGDWNNWNRYEHHLTKDEWGNWTIFLADNSKESVIKDKSLVKLHICGADGSRLDRIPAYIRRVIQDDETKDFCGQVWEPAEKFDWEDEEFHIEFNGSPVIYEAHIGMAQEKEGVGSYKEFEEIMLPRIKKLGYNAIQLMAIAEHPYYGSFGYHVSSFFAPSSRFGTPEDLKHLIQTAHKMGLAVIMDIVHSHYVKNIAEGINRLDGTDTLYSPAGDLGNHPYWDSKTFDYGKDEVQHFLLSNVKYWIDEFHFDGYRFDGVSSMIYHHFGYADFMNDPYGAFFGDEVNRDAILYLTLANKLVKSIKPSAITIAEDVSGMPAMASAIADGGIGFNYRLAMAIPDFWIKYLKEVPDEEWNLYEMWETMNSRLSDVKTIAYCESHDQALVGDKTIAFRLMDSEMYWNMDKTSNSLVVDRGLALHKMIRLFTITLGGNGYLNFMGNEFGHPEWIDFPREGNGWSYAHAQRKWSLAENGFLRYSFLEAFDSAMIHLVRKHHVMRSGYAFNHMNDDGNKTIVYEQAGLLFVFNWHTSNSVMDYEIPVPMAGEYKVILNSDDERFGGFGRVSSSVHYFSYERDGKHYIKIYNINRSALVFDLV
ncbi:MAG: alpha amylase C-terminal domain-containing protein [Rikenellaceae bacterium]